MGHSSSAYSFDRRIAQRQRDRGRHDDQLPAPEMEPTEEVAEHAGLAEPLHRVVDGGEDGVAGKGENGRVGVQRPQPAERQVRQPEAQRRQHEFQGDDQSDEEGDDAPQDGDHQKRANHGIVIDELFQRPLFQLDSTPWAGSPGVSPAGVVEPDVTIAPWRKVAGEKSRGFMRGRPGAGRDYRGYEGPPIPGLSPSNYPASSPFDKSRQEIMRSPETGE